MSTEANCLILCVIVCETNDWLTRPYLDPLEIETFEADVAGKRCCFHLLVQV